MTWSVIELLRIDKKLVHWTIRNRYSRRLGSFALYPHFQDTFVVEPTCWCGNRKDSIKGICCLLAAHMPECVGRSTLRSSSFIEGENWWFDKQCPGQLNACRVCRLPRSSPRWMHALKRMQMRGYYRRRVDFVDVINWRKVIFKDISKKCILSKESKKL